MICEGGECFVGVGIGEREAPGVIEDDGEWKVLEMTDCCMGAREPLYATAVTVAAERLDQSGEVRYGESREGCTAEAFASTVGSSFSGVDGVLSRG